MALQQLVVAAGELVMPGRVNEIQTPPVAAPVCGAFKAAENETAKDPTTVQRPRLQDSRHGAVGTPSSGERPPSQPDQRHGN